MESQMQDEQGFGGMVRRICKKISWLPPLLARITIGFIFVESGWGKLHNLQKVTEFFMSLGIPAAKIQAPFVAGVELVGGALVLVGLFTRYASVPLIGTMVVAIVTAKLEEISGLSDLFATSEFLYILLLTYLVVEGAGALSVDRLLCSRKHANR